MHSKTIRWMTGAALGMAIALAGAMESNVARAESPESHPDFLWWPTSTVGSSRLFVGNLTYEAPVEAQTISYNPTELTFSKDNR